ncbi:hypothetical protein D3C75_548530 [compost metagenome]
MFQPAALLLAVNSTYRPLLVELVVVCTPNPEALPATATPTAVSPVLTASGGRVVEVSQL